MFEVRDYGSSRGPVLFLPSCSVRSNKSHLKTIVFANGGGCAPPPPPPQPPRFFISRPSVLLVHTNPLQNSSCGIVSANGGGGIPGVQACF